MFYWLSLRVTLPLLGVSVSEISAGADRDLQTGGFGVVGQSQLQLSCHVGALIEAALCADAAVTALKEQKTGCDFTISSFKIKPLIE